jgi:isoleucyl-tRNA synthetase
VLARRPDLSLPADMYLEGTDQYRGWFQSSLLVGVGTRDQAPYRSVLTHGFVVDLEGRKMSKSLGNVVSPQQVMKDSGAEVIRLWVSMVNYQDEVRLGKEVLARTIEAYRKIRNTFRYLLSNLYDFNPDADAVPATRLLDVDRFALATYGRVVRQALAAYEAYDFQTVFHVANELVTVDLSSFYLDVSKDRLYTFRADSIERRSAQTAVYTIADGLARLLAPILSVTADEVWRLLPGTREPSVHLADFPALTPEIEGWSQDLDRGAFGARWSLVRSLRDAVNERLEAARQQKIIGKGLEAHVSLRVPADTQAVLAPVEGDLAMIFNTSSVSVGPLAAGDASLGVDVRRAAGSKCPRCWRFVTDIVTDGALEGICGRCADALGDRVAAAR